MENNINQIIRERRSHYPQEFSGKILEEDIISTLLENANWAPNHTLNYPWRFKILKGDDMVQWIDQAIELYRNDTPAEKFNQKKIDKMELYKSKVSHIIVIVHQKDIDKKAKEIEDVCAIACSVQNIYLSLSQFPNAVGYWSTGMGTFNKTMHAYLKLSESQNLMGYFMLGHIEVKRTESNRKPINEFIL
jgi:nitroreductase